MKRINLILALTVLLMHAAPACSEDALLLEARAVSSANSAIGAIWPGYRIDKPILIHFKAAGRLTLIGAKAVPKGFTRCSSGSKENIYCGNSADFSVRSSFVANYKFNGETVTFYGISNPLRPAEGQQLLFHENFHDFQQRTFKDPVKFFDPQPVAPESEASCRAENAALLRALLLDGQDRFTAAGEFVAMREARHRSASPQDLALEEYKERIEGSAEYVGLMSSVLPCGLGTAKTCATPNILRDSLFLAEIFNNGSNYYLSGMLQMAVLESLRIPWKARLASGTVIYDIFKEYFHSSEKSVAKIRDSYGYEQTLSKTREAGEKSFKKDSASEKRITDGAFVEITPPAYIKNAAGPQSHGEYRKLDDGRTFYSSAKLEVMDRGKFDLFTEGLPLLVGASPKPVIAGRAALYPNRYEISVNCLSDLRIIANGKPVPQGSGRVSFSDIEVTGKGMSLRATLPGALSLAEDRVIIEFSNK